MREIAILNLFFTMLKGKNRQEILNLLDRYVIVTDPMLGTLERNEACDYLTLIIDRLPLQELQEYFTEVNTFQAIIKWRINVCSVLTKATVTHSGLFTIEFNQEKIARINLQYSPFFLLGSLLGIRGYLYAVLPGFKKKLRELFLARIRADHSTVKELKDQFTSPAFH